VFEQRVNFLKADPDAALTQSKAAFAKSCSLSAIHRIIQRIGIVKKN
jgi:hypothetical protein